MPLPSFLQRFRRGGQAAAAPELNPMPPMDLEVARTRARRRLVGMLVLVVAGVLGFPWLFETQPRPMSQDVQIVQAPSAGGSAAGQGDRLPARSVSGRVGVAAISPPVLGGTDAPSEVDGGSPAREASMVEDSSEATAGKASVGAPEPAAPVKAVMPKPEPKPEAKSEPKPEPKAKPADKPADKSTDKKPADKKQADTKVADKATDKKPADKKDADKKDQRYVVQFGAFADVASAQAARAKVEKLGIKTYAQQVDTPAGKRTRVRVGPFADKAEAEKANAALRKAGMTGSVLIL